MMSYRRDLLNRLRAIRRNERTTNAAMAVALTCLIARIKTDRS